jgi:hypothetical protein
MARHAEQQTVTAFPYPLGRDGADAAPAPKGRGGAKATVASNRPEVRRAAGGKKY